MITQIISLDYNFLFGIYLFHKQNYLHNITYNTNAFRVCRSRARWRHTKHIKHINMRHKSQSEIYTLIHFLGCDRHLST